MAFLFKLLLGISLFVSTSVHADDNIDFDKDAAVYQWMGQDSQLGCLNFSSYFENGFTLGYRSIMQNSDRWAERAKATYAFGLSFPVPHEDMIVNQRPFTKERLPESSYLFIVDKKNPVQKILGILQDYGAYVCYREGDDESKKTAQEFVNEWNSLSGPTSVYKSAVLEFKTSGKIGFMPNVEKLKYEWDQIILDAKTKGELQTTLEHFLQSYDKTKWKQLGIPLSRGVLLDGPPGTGKSLIAKILISRTLSKKYKSMPTFIYVSARHVTTKESIRNIYAVARKLNPAVVFIEDVDLIAGTGRANKQDIKNELMQQLSGVEELEGVLTIATTNYGNLIDEALRRSRRLGYHHTIGMPKNNERKELFRLFLADVDAQSVNFDALVEASESLTGADIKELCRSAKEQALRRGSKGTDKIIVMQEDLQAALDFRAKTRVK